MSGAGDVPTIVCRVCKKDARLDTSNPARPFCSARCKWVDLGRWLDGTYAIPGEPVGSFDGMPLLPSAEGMTGAPATDRTSPFYGSEQDAQQPDSA